MRGRSLVLQLRGEAQNRVNCLITERMTPYPVPTRTYRRLSFQVLVFIGLTVACGRLSAQQADAQYKALTQSGFEHFYRLEYDRALADFQKARELRPEDPGALNHLLEAVLFQQLYKYNALNSKLYSGEGFLSSKQVAMDPAMQKQIKDLADQAQALSEKRLKANPNDVDALYARGVTEGMRSTYLVVVEHSWWGALNNALAARHDHEQVLKLRPDFVDAKTIVGAHNYVVGSLSLPVKILAGLRGIHGDKEKGLAYLAEAGRAEGESSADARVALSIFLRREKRYQSALDVVHSLTHDHPNNFLFALEEGNLLREEGKNADAAASFRRIVEGCRQGQYPNAHTEMAHMALADTLRDLKDYNNALVEYEAAGAPGGNDPELRQQALLSAGETADLLARRDQALTQYRAAIALNGSSSEADLARKYLERPYTGQ